MKSENFTSGREWWAVVNIDQRRSRTSPDRVPEMLTALSDLEVNLAPERTAGDEVQVLTRSPATVGRILEMVARTDDWRVGVGFGPVETPLPDTVREARGPAFVSAREAIDAAHGYPTHLALLATTDGVGAADYAGRVRRVAEANVVAGLLHHLWSRRTQEGWDVIDQLHSSGTGRATAEALNISASAVSQRLRTAGWLPGEQGSALLASMLADVLTDGGDDQ